MHDAGDAMSEAPGVARWWPRRGTDVSVCAAARAWVLAALPHLLARPAEGRLRDNVELLVSELTANALLHAGGVEYIDLYCTGSVLRICVHDQVSTPAVARHAPPDEAEHGRGLLLVDALAARWGVEEHPGAGKDVWLELPIDR
ncbi:ATP-binding protein [Dactylosporangium sp. CA-233914]|uniref:ATP-binding protein n=1 Tax=Dactylosporangium sp. CA-233914 TaxID=3239934 RepID=UPI003D89C7EF